MNSLVVICALVAGVSAGTLPAGLVGNSGIVARDGRNIQFTREMAENIAVAGPSGIVMKDGSHYQLVGDAFVRTKRSAPTLPVGLVGTSGIVARDGRNIQFTREMAENIAVAGPSGIVMKDGSHYQLVGDAFVRTKRSAGFVSTRGNIGFSGILRADGSTDLFDHDMAHDILLIGPSGIVTKSGRNLQLTDDLKIVGRTKRHLIGDSGIILDDGTTHQLSGPATILLEGPSGIIMSDGTIIQKRGKRSTTFGHTVGNSGIITSDGQLFQLGHGVSVVSVGPSGAILSDGRNIQF